MYLIDIWLKSLDLRCVLYVDLATTYCATACPLFCSEYVAQYSFVWTVSRLCRYTIGYVIGVFVTQVVILVVVDPFG